MKEHIQYDFLCDNHFNEVKNIEMMNQRMRTVSQMDPFVGKYFSTEYIRKEILGQTANDMREIDKQMRSDIDTGLAIDPVEVIVLDNMQQTNQALAPEIQGVHVDDAAESDAG